jgi:acyl-CoA dehydrogenase
MDFGQDPRVAELGELLSAFLDAYVYPAEPVYATQAAELAAAGRPFDRPPVLDELKTAARERGLWNLFLPGTEYGAGLSVAQYAPLAELTGRSPKLAPEALNCSAPDTGNMEILAAFGTPEQRERWLRPLLDGTIRSAFSMTEPEVASADPTNLTTRIEPDGAEHYRVTGRKWWSTGALSPHAAFTIVMGVTAPDAEPHRRASMLIVPLDTPGVRLLRTTTVLGYTDGPRGGHAEVVFDGARVPRANLLGAEGSGFAIAQARLGPGRVHHCMRLLGMAERALELMCRRVLARTAFGGPLADQGVLRDWIAESRIRIEQARLLVLKTAWLIDTQGNRAARDEVSAIKAVVPEVACWVIDRSMQAHGAAGLSDDLPLASLYAAARSLRIADGPDEVHRRSIARRELRRYQG